jgi:predicted nuclease of predicted toxin-antitoxin system
VRILADQHISPRTVEFLRALGHDAIRVTDRLSCDAGDTEILSVAAGENRLVLTQDLDFTGLVATSGREGPSLIILRLGSPSVEHVNEVLRSVLPAVEEAVRAGAIVSVDDDRIRVRRLPIQ